MKLQQGTGICTLQKNGGECANPTRKVSSIPCGKTLIKKTGWIRPENITQMILTFGGGGIETDLSLSDLPPSIEKPVTEKCKEQVFKILFHQCPILMPDKEEY